MSERFQLKMKGGAWHILARKGAGAAWITVGGCPCHINAMRVYLALMARGGR